MVETIHEADIVDYFPEREIVGYVRDTCVELVAITESSSPDEPYRTSSDKVVHGAVRTYLGYAL